MSFEVTLPSGLKGSVKELGVQEENILSDPKLARSGRNLQQVLQSCWVQTLDTGIYQIDLAKELDVRDLLQGDAMVLLMKLRIATYGPEFYFDANCPLCGTKIEWQVDLNEFLEVKTRPLPEESVAILKNDGIFEVVLPRCKRPVKFRLLRMRDELRFPEIRKRNSNQLSSYLLDLQIQSVEGIERKSAFLGLEGYPAKGYDGPKEVLGSGDASYFRDEVEEVSCGVITRIEIDCLDHGEVVVDLPFREGFLIPKRRSR